MSDQPAAGVKTCNACGADVTSGPRVKDTKGNYFCKPCAAKMRAQLAKQLKKTAGAPLPPPPLSGDPDVMDKLIADSVAASAAACPACRRPWTGDAVICVGCGFNRRTQQMMGTQMIAPAAPSAAGNAAKAVGKAAAAGLSPVFAAAGAAIGGAIGAGIWAAVAYNLNLQVGYIAWAIGLLTGVGAALGARQYAGVLSGLIAVFFAVLSILVAKFLAVEWILKDLGGSEAVGVAAQEGVVNTLGPLDLLFFGLAIITAAGVGSKGQISIGGD